MLIQVKMQENGKKNIFRDKETRNRVPLKMLDLKVFTGR